MQLMELFFLFGAAFCTLRRIFAITMTIDKNIEIAHLQSEISKYIGLGENSLVFHFEEQGRSTVLRLITVNPRHNQSFLFHTVESASKVESLRLMLEYVKNYKEEESSFTIQWTVKGDNNLHTSYFRAKNILSALDKLYYDRDPNSITVFSVMMNPIS
jgi:hypothetical protein